MDDDKNIKLDLFINIRRLEQYGIKCDDIVTMESSIEHLTFVYELMKAQHDELVMCHNVDKIVATRVIGLQTIIKKYDKTESNDDISKNVMTWGPPVWEILGKLACDKIN
jgi:hypothetical protein